MHGYIISLYSQDPHPIPTEWAVVSFFVFHMLLSWSRETVGVFFIVYFHVNYMKLKVLLYQW